MSLRISPFRKETTSVEVANPSDCLRFSVFVRVKPGMEAQADALFESLGVTARQRYPHLDPTLHEVRVAPARADVLGEELEAHSHLFDSVDVLHGCVDGTELQPDPGMREPAVELP
jgi:hypothetical protein